MRITFTEHNLFTEPRFSRAPTSPIRCDIVTVVDAQIVGLQSNVDKQHKEQQTLISYRKSMENKFGESYSDVFNATEVDEKIQKACESTQTIEELQDIHNAHKAVKSKTKDIETAEDHLKALCKAKSQLEDQLSCLEKKQQKIVTQVHTCMLADL